MTTKCIVCKQATVARGRLELGIKSCLQCGEKSAQKLANARKQQCAPAYNKGAYQYITKNDLKEIGR